MEKLNEAADYIRSRLTAETDTALILGSGLGDLGDTAENAVRIPYSDIPHFPSSTAPGHRGQLVSGFLDSVPVLIMQGRFHYYEGYGMDVITFPIRVFKLLGIRKLIVTNAAGGINTGFAPGDLMLISDHIKMGGDHPLRGPNDDTFGPRFHDMSDAYWKEGRKTVRKAAEKLHTGLREGVYAYMTGPSFETPAEIRMLRTLGADAVGMSTVPEVITASHCGIQVIGISCISNMAAGILDQPITSEEVIETGKMAAQKFSALIREALKTL
jgi:purine-nucleoside phosphorylase